MGGVVCTTLISSDLPTVDAERSAGELRRAKATTAERCRGMPAVSSNGLFGRLPFAGLPTGGDQVALDLRVSLFPAVTCHLIGSVVRAQARMSAARCRFSGLQHFCDQSRIFLALSCR